MSTLMTIILLVIVSVILIIIAVRSISLAMGNVRPDENFPIAIATLALSFFIIMSIMISTSSPNHNKKNVSNNKNLTIKKINNKNLTIKKEVK